MKKTSNLEQDDMPTRATPVVELSEEQTESLLGKIPEEGDAVTVTLAMSKRLDSGGYEFTIDREGSDEEDESLSDEALGYPRSKSVKPKPAPNLSAADLQY